jgi:RimJ/RimL family protein N-acetyltransferase
VLKPNLPIQTERLLLRGSTIDDVEAMYAYKSREDVTRYVPHSPLSRDEIAERLADRWSLTELTEEDQGLTLVIEERSSGRVVGDVVLFWRSAEHRLGEIGYMLSPDAMGHGYATETSRELLRIGFEEFALHRIIARLDARNTASARVLERLGMRREALHLEDEWFKGEWSDTLVYAMLVHEWQGSSGLKR